MEGYTRDSFRAIRDEMEHARQQKRGSILITLLIIAIFIFAAGFYIKTSKPQLWNSAIQYIKSVSVGGKSLETISQALFNKAKEDKTETSEQTQPTENTDGESGDMLLTADNLSFNYISQPLNIDTLGSGADSDTAVPVMNATVTSNFGSRTDPVTGEKSAGHHGIDLAASPGSTIYAYADGTVTETGQSDIYGNYVIVDHGSGLSTFYGHMSSVTVEKADKVSAGGKLGIIGSTGKSTGIHLHFEVRINGERVDPASYLYEKI